MVTRQFSITLLGERGYTRIKHFVKRLLCFVRGARNSGLNVYMSPWAIVKRGQRLTLGDNVVVERGVRLWVDTDKSSIKIGDNSYLSSHCILNTFDGWITMGSHCTVNSYAILFGKGGLQIGNDVRIAPQVMIMPTNHIYENPDMPIWKQGLRGKGIKIEDDVWLGAGAIVLDGVIIGKGSVIGAGAVVTENIPPFSVAVGVPAKVIKKRIKQKK